MVLCVGIACNDVMSFPCAGADPENKLGGGGHQE